jgi:hypothetical protein
MLSGKELAIQELLKNCQEALTRAKELRKIATLQSTAGEAVRYLQQARFEMDKARGYLKQAAILEKTRPKGDSEAA